MKELKYIRLYEEEETWIRMTPRQLSEKIEEIFALNDFDKITEEFRKIKEKHSYVQHPPWRKIWDEAMARWAEMGKDKVEAVPEVPEGDPKQPMRDYLASIGFNFPFVEKLISDAPIPESDLNRIAKVAEQLLDARKILKQKDQFIAQLKANPPDPKNPPPTPKFATHISVDNFVKACTIISLIMAYHKDELQTQNFMGLFWIGKYAEMMDAWSIVIGEKDDDDDETAIAAFIGVDKQIKKLLFNEKHSGPRSDLEKNIDKFGLFFKHRSEEKKELEFAPEDLEQLKNDPQPVIDGIFSIGNFSKVTMVLRKLKPEVLKLPNGNELWKTIIERWHKDFEREIKYAETGEQDTN